jgi:hypothetical protein
MGRRDRKARHSCLLCVFVWGTSGSLTLRSSLRHSAKTLENRNAFARAAHIYIKDGHGGKSIRTRRLDRYDGAGRRVPPSVENDRNYSKDRLRFRKNQWKLWSPQKRVLLLSA